MRIAPPSTFAACATGTRLPRRMPFRSQTAARRLVMSGRLSSHPSASSLSKIVSTRDLTELSPPPPPPPPQPPPSLPRRPPATLHLRGRHPPAAETGHAPTGQAPSGHAPTG